MRTMRPRYAVEEGPVAAALPALWRRNGKSRRTCCRQKRFELRLERTRFGGNDHAESAQPARLATGAIEVRSGSYHPRWQRFRSCRSRQSRLTDAGQSYLRWRSKSIVPGIFEWAFPPAEPALHRQTESATHRSIAVVSVPPR